MLKTFSDRAEFFSYCCSKASEGSCLEFGVYRGQSLKWMAEIFSGRPVSGFDSFDGLPEPFKNHKKGHFRADIPDFSEFTNVHIYQGDFEDTIPLYKSWVKNKKIAFIHVDCDLYSSTKTVLTMLKANIKPGTIIVFDEYQEHEEYIKNEQKAFLEMKFNYEIFAQTKHRVGLRIIGA